jgi:hypothetical protein
MNCAVHAATTHQRAIRRVDDGIRVFFRDVANVDRNPASQENSRSSHDIFIFVLRSANYCEGQTSSEGGFETRPYETAFFLCVP